MKTKDLYIPNTGLTARDQLELGKQMSTLDDEMARQTLVLNCIPMVKSIAKRFMYNQYSNFDDIFQDGMLGVLEAIKGYDYKKNVQFTSYAYLFIVHSIISGIRRQLPISVSERHYHYFSIINATVKSYEEEFNEPPTDEQLFEFTSIPLKIITQIRQHDLKKMFVSIEGNPNLLEDFGFSSISSVQNNFVALIENRQINEHQKQLIEEALQALTPEEKEVIVSRYLNSPTATFKELAEKQQVCINTIVKHKNRALLKLYKYFSDRCIDFVDLI